MKNWIFKDEPRAPYDPKTARKRATLLSIPFAALGIFALVLLLHDGLLGGLDRRKTFGLLGAIAASIGFVALIFGISAKKEAIKTGSQKTSNDEKPWLKREDWAAGQIVSSSRKAVLILWIIVLLWLGMSAAITLVAVPRGNYAVLAVLVIVAVAVLIFTVRTTRARWRFGRSIFEMAAIPAAVGGTLEGEIQVRGRLQPQHGIHLRLSCVRRVTSGASNNRRTTEKILWQDEKWLRPDLPQTDLNATGIPVFFRLPGDKPESSPTVGDGIHWKLEASAKLRGPDFHAAFEAPVFKLSEPPQISDDPTAQYQMPLDEIRKQIHSKIQIADLPNGREFIFPAARNPVFASGATIFCLIWTGLIALLVWKHAPPLVPLIFGVMVLLMAAFAADLWFRRSRVTIATGEIKIETAWLAFKKQTLLKISDAANFSADAGATAGHWAYYDLKLKTRDGKDLTLAKNLGHKPEAEWLARQMTAAAKDFPATDSNP